MTGVRKIARQARKPQHKTWREQLSIVMATKVTQVIFLSLPLLTVVSCSTGAGRNSEGKVHQTAASPKAGSTPLPNHSLPQSSSTSTEPDRALPLPSQSISDNGSEPRIDINTAPADQLTRLPGVGPGFAKKIIDYREKHGPFRRPQDLIIISGFGEKKYRKLEKFICVR